MKVIVNKRTGICMYILPDQMDVVLEETIIRIGSTIITDLSVNTAILLENQNPPISEGATLRYSEENGYQLYFEYGQRTLPEIKAYLKEQLSDITSELTMLITKIRLIHEPEPEALKQLIVTARSAYNAAVQDIDALTEDDIRNWRLRSPELAGLMAAFKALV